MKIIDVVRAIRKNKCVITTTYILLGSHKIIAIPQPTMQYIVHKLINKSNRMNNQLCLSHKTLKLCNYHYSYNNSNYSQF